jgi:UDP-3-O-[3-hydroxymyristoyl] N-acetylglucosamine deacetylase / 3-hydroxyacyl-[acyl-carrier-protein] dehydratase
LELADDEPRNESVTQRTIAKEARISGIGLHSGEHCDVVFKPAPPNAGMMFVRVDLAGKPSIKAHPRHLCQRMRRTALADTVAGVDVEVHTTEHLVAACYGLGIDNLIIEMNSVEMPGLDGSAVEFGNVLRAAGIVDQKVARKSFDVSEPIAVDDGKSSLVVLPYKAGLRITYTLDDHGGALSGAQVIELDVTEENFYHQIAPARTFCLAKEVEMLRAMGLGKGANYQNTCVYDGTKVIDNELRFPDEAARHKVLDLIGDLALSLDRRINAHVIAFRSGHKENMALVKELNRRIELSEKPKFVFDIRQILSLLPHRYPILMVDRIIDYEPGKRITGIKNVTINEEFFRGHFPDNPVMPAVLQVEAMAQTGAVMLMTNPEHRGKIPYFMSMDKVKFRRAIYPGDQMRIEVEALRVRSRMAACLARVFVENQLCAEAEIRSVMVDE